MIKIILTIIVTMSLASCGPKSIKSQCRALCRNAIEVCPEEYTEYKDDCRVICINSAGPVTVKHRVCISNADSCEEINKCAEIEEEYDYTPQTYAPWESCFRPKDTL